MAQHEGMALATGASCPAAAGSVVSELMARGRHSAVVLEALLQGGSASAPAHGGIRELAAEILRCCDRALAALHASGCAVDAAGAGADRKRKSAPGGATAQLRPKRRVRTSSGETPTRIVTQCTAEDGFMWRKYGQKEIQNSKHPRLYFRCTYNHDSGCPAKRQVQQSEDDPSLYVITYFGDHTCCREAAADADVGAGGEARPFVINFGSAAASGGASPWLSSSSSNDAVRNETSLSSSSQPVLLPVEDGEELPLKVAKVESTSSDSKPAAAAELSSSTDVSCSSPAWDPLHGCLDWDCFAESSFDDIIEQFNFDDIAPYQ